MEARLEAVIGGMYSGKSTELIKRLRRFELGGETVALFKPRIDDRYSEDSVVTHTGLRHPAKVVSTSAEIMEVLENYRDHYPAFPKVVGIDEAQFFDEDLYPHLCSLVRIDYCRVIVAGLDLNFKAEPWPTMVPIVFGADRVSKLSAVCTAVDAGSPGAGKCGMDAIRTQRIVNGRPVFDGQDVLVGGTEAYEARCRHCFAGRP